MDELQEMLLEENPLSRGDVYDLAWEWAARVDEAELLEPSWGGKSSRGVASPR